MSSFANQIDNQRMAIQGKDGVVERVKALPMERWENCVGYKTMQVQEGGDKFSIHYDNTSAGQSANRYTIDIATHSCDCGQCQEHGFPRIHAMAFFRRHQKK
jgi:hypothetical protein